jgi:predicted transposase
MEKGNEEELANICSEGSRQGGRQGDENGSSDENRFHDASQLHSLDELMRVFGSAKRYAFHRLLEGRNAKDIIQHLPHQFRLNKRYAEDTVLLVQALISSKRELRPMRLEDVRAKIEKTAKKIESMGYPSMKVPLW